MQLHQVTALPAGTPLTLRQVYRVAAVLAPLSGQAPYTKAQRRAILAAAVAVQAITPIMPDDAADLAAGYMPMGYNIPAHAADPWYVLRRAICAGC